MDLSVKEVIEGILYSKESTETPSDNVKPSELVMELPEWYDEKKFNRGRKFFNDFRFYLMTSMMMGLVTVFAVPSILRVLVGSRRSNSVFTAYRRYLSTLLHTVAWFEHELKPGSTSWRSLYTVRSRHLRASLSSKAKGTGVVSQRDIALTQFGFIGFSLLKPDFFGIRQLTPGDWEAYNHVWQVIGHMIGLEDRYNICRNTVEETREMCQVLLDRVFIPCMENVPEYFEHMARVMLDGMWCVNPTIDSTAFLFWCRVVTGVPGYVYFEKDRIDLQVRIRKALNGKSPDDDVPVSSLMCEAAVEGLPARAPRPLRLRDYDSVEHSPPYQGLSFRAKYKLFFNYLCIIFYNSHIGRWYFNAHFSISLFFMRYCPYLAFFKFGIKRSLVNIFTEDPTDDTVPKPNAEYYKPQPSLPWYREVLTLLW